MHRDWITRVGGCALLVMLLALVQVSPPASAQAQGDLAPKFKFLISAQPYQPEHFEACSMVAEEVKKLGFNVEVVTHPSWGAFTAQVGPPYDWGMACQGYVPREDRLEPNQIMGTYQSGFAENGPNYAGYKNPEYDKAIQEEISRLDMRQRRPAILRAQEIMARDVPFIAMYHPSLTHVYNKSKFGDVVPIPGVGLWNVTNFIKARPLTTDTIYRVGYVGDMNNLNPVAPIASFDLDVIRLVWDTLGKFEGDGTVAPWMAESWNVVNPTTLRVTLRDGLRFHDNTPVTAKDVAFTYNYLIKWQPSWYRTVMQAIKSVEAVDNRTVVFNLKQPFGPIYLTFAWVPILPQHLWRDIVEKEGANTPAALKTIPRVGSGPYRWVLQTSQSLRLVRNISHFSPPKASEFLWISFSNREAHFLAMVNGDIFFHEQKGMTITQMEEAKRYPQLGVISEPSITVYWLIFNMRDSSPFKDFTLRHAVAHLLDYKAFVQDILKGQGEPGRGMIAPANKFWHNASIPSKETPGKVHYHQYDPAKARAILTEAGFTWDREGKIHLPATYRATILPTNQNCCN